MIIELNDNDVNEKIKQSKGILLIDFWAEWCGPCKNFKPIYEMFSEKNKDIVCYQMDIDKNKYLPSILNIRGVPTIAMYKNGELKDMKVGMMSLAQLEGFVSIHK